MEASNYEKRGYLYEPFRLFHLADPIQEPLEFHYHTFHKIFFLLAGKAGYAIEGTRYTLEPGDFVLVGSGSIHRPEVAAGDYCERAVLYLSPAFLSGAEGCDLSGCFCRAQQDFHYVYRATAADRVRPLLSSLEAALQDRDFGAELLRRTLLFQLMIEINRLCAHRPYITAAGGDGRIVSLLQYLSLHLGEPLSVEELAARFYVSKFHLMRRFKEETGYTIHRYITEKRLLLARQLLQAGTSLSESCRLAGFQDYSTFSRAYRKRFGAAPSRDLNRR